MAGIPVWVYTNTQSIWTRFGFYFKVYQPVVADTTLVDLDFGGVDGYFRAKLRSDGHVVIEGNFKGHTGSIDLTEPGILDVASQVIVQPGKWYWVSALMGVPGSSDANYWLLGMVWAPDGHSQGGHVEVSAPSDTLAVTAKLGWGVSLSSTYRDFDNFPGNEMDSLVIDTNGTILPSIASPTNNTGPWPPPVADIDPAAPSPGINLSAPHIFPSALYLCHEPVGSTDILRDSTSNHYDLIPGNQGFVVVSDGPY